MITRRTFLKTLTGAVAALALGVFPRAQRYERVVIAAADAPASVKRIAHYQCRGTNDQLVIQRAIDQGGHSIILVHGTYLDEPIRLRGGNHLITNSRFVGAGFEITQ